MTPQPSPQPPLPAFAGALAWATSLVPDLQVVLTPDCHGREWLVDSCCSTIYIADDLSTEDAVAALNAATSVLLDDELQLGLPGMVSIPQPHGSR